MLDIGQSPTTQVLADGLLHQIGQCRIPFPQRLQLMNKRTNALTNFFLSTCPSPSKRRRQSPNGSPPPKRVRDRRGRRDVEGEECGGVSAGGMAYAPPGRRRAFRVRIARMP